MKQEEIRHFIEWCMEHLWVTVTDGMNNDSAIYLDGAEIAGIRNDSEYYVSRNDMSASVLNLYRTWKDYE